MSAPGEVLEKVEGVLPDQQIPAEPPPPAKEPDSVGESVRAALKEVRARDEQGRFKAEDQPRPEGSRRSGTLTLPAGKPAAQEPASPSTASQPSRDTGTAEAQQATPAPAPVKAPDSWKGEAKAKFGELPAWAQAEVSRREGEMTRAATQFDGDRTLGKQIRETAAPYEREFAAHGAKIEQAWPNYLQTIRTLTFASPQEKVAALYNIARLYNVPLGQPQQGQSSDPTIASLQQEILQLRQQTADLMNGRQADLTQRQQEETSYYQSEVEAFAAAEGHEYLDTVRPLMVAFLNSEQAQDLQSAYDMAVWAHPEVRAALQQQQTAQQLAAKAQEAQKRTEAARKAGVSVTGSPGGTSPVLNGGGVERSLRDELRANLAAAQGRV